MCARAINVRERETTISRWRFMFSACHAQIVLTQPSVRNGGDGGGGGVLPCCLDSTPASLGDSHCSATATSQTYRTYRSALCMDTRIARGRRGTCSTDSKQ